MTQLLPHTRWQSYWELLCSKDWLQTCKKTRVTQWRDFRSKICSLYVCELFAVTRHIYRSSGRVCVMLHGLRGNLSSHLHDARVAEYSQVSHQGRSRQVKVYEVLFRSRAVVVKLSSLFFRSFQAYRTISASLRRALLAYLSHNQISSLVCKVVTWAERRAWTSTRTDEFNAKANQSWINEMFLIILSMERDPFLSKESDSLRSYRVHISPTM